MLVRCAERINFVDLLGHALSHKEKIQALLEFLFFTSCPFKQSLIATCEKQKNHQKGGFFIYRGPERIRTAVGAFAELSLATRPQDLLK